MTPARTKLILIIAVLGLTIWPQPGLAKVKRAPQPRAYIAVDAATGRVRRYLRPNQVWPIASLTKLMTAYLLLPRLQFDQPVMLTHADLDHVKAYVEATAKVSNSGLEAGETVLVEDLWVALLASSANEAAPALVRAAGYGEAEFVELMNSTAKRWGLKKTHFTEPSGIDVANVSTPREFAVIAKKALAKDFISGASLVTERTVEVRDTKRQVKLVNRNFSLLKMDPTGAKTGYLTEARSNAALLFGTAKRGKIIVVFGAPNLNSRNATVKALIR